MERNKIKDIATRGVLGLWAIGLVTGCAPVDATSNGAITEASNQPAAPGNIIHVDGCQYVEDSESGKVIWITGDNGTSVHEPADRVAAANGEVYCNFDFDYRP